MKRNSLNNICTLLVKFSIIVKHEQEQEEEKEEEYF